jgi:hypothetical protein
LARWCRVFDAHCGMLRVSVEHSGTTCFYISASVKRLLRTSTVGWISCDGSQLSSSVSSSVKQVRYAVEIVCSFLSELVSFWLSSLVLIRGLPFSSFLLFLLQFRCWLLSFRGCLCVHVGSIKAKSSLVMPTAHLS